MNDLVSIIYKAFLDPGVLLIRLLTQITNGNSNPFTLFLLLINRVSFILRLVSYALLTFQPKFLGMDCSSASATKYVSLPFSVKMMPISSANTVGLFFLYP